MSVKHWFHWLWLHKQWSLWENKSPGCSNNIGDFFLICSSLDGHSSCIKAMGLKCKDWTFHLCFCSYFSVHEEICMLNSWYIQLPISSGTRPEALSCCFHASLLYSQTYSGSTLAKRILKQKHVFVSPDQNAEFQALQSVSKPPYEVLLNNVGKWCLITERYIRPFILMITHQSLSAPKTAFTVTMICMCRNVFIFIDLCLKFCHFSDDK